MRRVLSLMDVFLTNVFLAPTPAKPTFLSSTGLDDWKFALPIGLVTAQAAVANEVVILDVQFQMGCIFMFTVATLYAGAGGAIGKSLDDYSQGVKDHVSQVDRETLYELTESIKSNEKLIQLESDVGSLQTLSDDLAVAQADVLNHMNQLKYREAITKKLDSLVAIEEAAVNAVRSRMLTRVKADVLKSFSTDPKTKESALTQAISVLSAGANAKFGKDIVGEQFAVAVKKYKEEYAKLPKGGDEILVQLERDLAAVALGPAVEEETIVHAESFLLGNQIKV